MKHLASILWLSALVLLCACGGGGKEGAGGGGIPVPTAHGLNIAGNWHFSTTSTVSGTPPVTIAGSINQSGSSVSGAVHVDGSNCFDQLTALFLTGTLTGGNILLKSTSINGQVATFTGSITETAFTGTYAISGGCDDGDHGNITGAKIPSIDGQMNGAFTASGGGTFGATAQINQGNNTSNGTFGLTGSFAFGPACPSSGTITSGTFPSGSFIVGTSVTLVIEASSGTVIFHGTADRVSGEISGDYTVSGSSCDQSGTAVLQADVWGY